MKRQAAFSMLIFALLSLSTVLFWWHSFLEEQFYFSVTQFEKQLPTKYQKQAAGPDSRPSDWAWLQRVFPHGTANKTAHLEAIQQARKMRSRLVNSIESDSDRKDVLRTIPWQFAGPRNIGGRISDIEYDPTNPNIVYAGAATGGVFKSYDGGWTWQPVFDEQAALSIGDIAVDPLDPLSIYVGTGEANGGHNNFPGGGLYKSEDGGRTWRLIGLEQTTSIGRIVIDPMNSQRVFVAAVGSYFGPDPHRGVYFSPDAGQTWQKSLFVSDSTGAIDLIMNPKNPQVLHAAMWERVRRAHSSHLFGRTSGIYRSTNGGRSWKRLGAANGVLPDEGDEQVGRIGLALCQAQPNIIYALYSDGYLHRACYKSIDEGLTWHQVDPRKKILIGSGNFCWYFGNIRVHPQNPDQVFALDVSFMRSDDGGQQWPIRYGYGNPFDDFHVDHHALAFHPFHPDTIIDGNDGGINISYNAGLGWKKVADLPVTQFYEITIDPTHPERLYGGTQDNGTLRTLTGRTNDWEEIYGGDGFYVIVDPRDANVIYAESQYGFLGKSMNGGWGFRNAIDGINLDEPRNWSTPVVMAPNQSNVLYYGTDRIYRTENGADYWFPISPDLTKQLPDSRLGTVTTIAVAPTNSSVIYAGTDDGNVWVSENFGSTWRNITNGLPFRWVTRVAIDPTNEKSAYVTFSGLKWKSPQAHVFRTENMGRQWVDISNNLPDAPVNIIVVDPTQPNYLYIGSDVGCFFSSNYGQSWDVLGEGLPIVPVYSMALHAESRLLAIGTHGRSMYTLPLNNTRQIKVSAFTTVPKRDGLELQWQTDQPENHSRFSIERKVADGQFVEIDLVNKTSANSQGNHYSYFDQEVPPGTIQYRLKLVDENGNLCYSKCLAVEWPVTNEFALAQNYPNPFNASTTIDYQVKEKALVSIQIYDELGRLVRTLVNAERVPGTYQVTWQGETDKRQPVASGVYFYRMQANAYHCVRRLFYLK